VAKPSAKRRQKARQRKETRRKEKRSFLSRLFQSPRALLRASGSWSLYECLLTKEWQKEGTIVQILVARRSLFDTRREYEELRKGIMAHQDMIKADLNLVAKIIREAIAYAQDLGFKPDPDYRDAMLVLGDADPDACNIPIPLGGRDGKPFFIAGPYDNVDRIMAKLTRKLGPDGFHFLVPVGGDEEIFLPDT